MASYKKTITSADIGQQPTRSTADVQIDAEQARAASLWANPQQLLAGLPKPSAFQSAVNAGLMGLKAGQAIPTATPEVAALTGALTGLGSQMPFEQAYQQNAMEQIDMLPIEQVSPALVQAFPEAQGIPLGVFQKLSGIFSAMGKQKASTGVADPATQKLLLEMGFSQDEIANIPLKAAQFIIGEKGKMARAEVKTVTKEEASEFAPLLGISVDNLMKQDRNRVLSAVSRIKSRQERVQWQNTPWIVNGTEFGVAQFSPETGGVRYVTKAGGGKAAQTLQQLVNLRNNLNDLYDEAAGYNTGRLKGGVDFAKALAGSEPQMRAFDSLVKIQRSNIAKIVGGDVGNLAQQEQVVAENALPEVFTKWGQLADNPAELEAKRKILNDLLDNKISAVMTTYGGGVFQGGKPQPKGKPESADPLGIR